MNEIVAVFHHLGYSAAQRTQVESDFYNFEALELPHLTTPRATPRRRSFWLVSRQNPRATGLLMRTRARLRQSRIAA